MPKISELNAISTLLDDDLIAIAHDVNGLPSTKKITVGNFANSIAENYSTAFKLNVLPTSNTNEGYVLSWDDAANAAIWQAFSGVQAYKLVNTANSYSATKHDNNIFASPNSISDNIRIILPDSTSNPPAIAGKIYTIKNIDSGYIVTVTTTDAAASGSNTIEDPVTGAFITQYDLEQKGAGDSWQFDGTAYKHIAAQRAVPTFYTSVDTYAQVAVKNASAANNASTDLVLYNNAADINGEGGPYIDIGINSTTYNQAQYDITGPSDGYLYTRAANLAIGTSNTGKSLVLHAGGTTAADVKMVVNTSAVYVNSTMVLINTTPSASPEIINIYSQNKINIAANNKTFSIATDGLVSLPGLLKAPQSTKANNSIGSAGMISWDSNNIYVCVGTNSWKKVSLNDF